MAKATKPAPRKIYVAGPMTGLPDFNRGVFHRIAMDVLQNGDIPLNPATLPDGLTQREYMHISGAMLMCADCIVLLPGWEKSKGAIAEHALAAKLELDIMFVDFLPTNEVTPPEAEKIN